MSKYFYLKKKFLPSLPPKKNKKKPNPIILYAFKHQCYTVLLCGLGEGADFTGELLKDSLSSVEVD